MAVVKNWIKLHEQLRYAHVVVFYVSEIMDKSICIVDTCVDKGSSYHLNHVICVEQF